MRTLYILLALTLTACGGSGSSPPPPIVPPPGPPPIMSLDGIYRGSPVVVSADGFTYDYEGDTADPFNGSVGRVYTTTVNADNTVDGTATIYRNSGPPETAALSGTINGRGDMSLTFADGQVGTVTVDVSLLSESPINIMGRAWCSYRAGSLYGCGEFDVLSRLLVPHPACGDAGNFLDIELGPEETTNVYPVTVTATGNQCSGQGTKSGLASFAISEDGLSDELVINIVGNGQYIWFRILATIP
jgi:hypothetical protein